MRLLLFILYSFSCMPFLKGQDLTGNWKGYFIPNAEGGTKVLGYEMNIKEKSNHELTASTYSTFHDGFSATAFATGFHSTATQLVSIYEINFENVKLEGRSQACLMTNYLEYKSLKDHEILEGTYTSLNAKTGLDCGGGKVYLERLKPLEINTIKKNIADKKSNPLFNPSIPLQTPQFNIQHTEKKKEKAKINAIAPKNKDQKNVNTQSTKSKDPNIKTSASITPSQSKLLAKNALESKVKDQTEAIQKSNVATKEEIATEVNETENNSTETGKSTINKLQVIPWVLVGRENKLVKKIFTNNKQISIDLYDNGTIDNDTILVYDNKQLIVAKKRLSYKAIHIDLTFSETNNEHEIIIVAHNMGTVPPNTALLVLKDGNTRQEYFITSTNKINAKLLIEFVPPKVPVKPD